MLIGVKKLWRTKIQALILERAPVCDEITLRQRNIFILPSRNGLLFLLSAGLIFVAAINYAVSLAFGLAFMMISIFIVAVLHTFNNLNGLVISALPTKPVFQGDEVGFNLQLSRGALRTYESLQLDFPAFATSLERGSAVSTVDLLHRDRDQAQVFWTASRRGVLTAPVLRIQTYFPLGIVRAWTFVRLNMHCLVYPRPTKVVMDKIGAGARECEESADFRVGNQEYYGIREYVEGDSMHRVAWKAVARGQGMKVKQFVDYQDNQTWLDWDLFYGFGVEERLSRLCYCVLELSKRDDPFGLKIPGLEVQPGQGLEHRNRLLKALAMFGGEQG